MGRAEVASWLGVDVVSAGLNTTRKKTAPPLGIVGILHHRHLTPLLLLQTLVLITLHPCPLYFTDGGTTRYSHKALLLLLPFSSTPPHNLLRPASHNHISLMFFPLRHLMLLS
eukprot:TRINITY_DN1247_c0_g1_i14.p2 TRINITY_DN1247_c0_g1~~TRINITY_DN1247_c0_g1_i14.p2  ORF type:complete len:113 (+),score=6.15 TRINITY_DN1247_c0_g1_i14:261-599(+)